MKHNFKPGDKVKYTAKFLKNTGQYTGRGGSVRGIISSESTDLGNSFVKVLWADQTETWAVNVANIMLANKADTTGL